MDKNVVSKRLEEALLDSHLSQAEVVKKTNISKGALSSYLSGRYVPKQSNIYKLAELFDVNPAWLMGYDVPKLNNNNNNIKLGTELEKIFIQISSELNLEYNDLISIFLSKKSETNSLNYDNLYLFFKNYFIEKNNKDKKEL